MGHSYFNKTGCIYIVVQWLYWQLTEQSVGIGVAE